MARGYSDVVGVDIKYQARKKHPFKVRLAYRDSPKDAVELEVDTIDFDDKWNHKTIHKDKFGIFIRFTSPTFSTRSVILFEAPETGRLILMDEGRWFNFMNLERMQPRRMNRVRRPFRRT